MLRYLIPSAGHLVRHRAFARCTVVHWRIGLRSGTPPLTRGPFDTEGIRWVDAPRGHFYADPFPARRNGQDWLFFEDYSYAKQRGGICAAPVQPDGSLGQTVPVLERPYHLSYPFLFEQDGELFLIPESGANRNVQLFRCRRFPDDWEFVRVLFEGPAADTTVLSHQGSLWFFTSLLDRPASEQLFLFSAPTLFDPWIYHPANPISLDIRTARCGGAFFSQDNQVVRVAQDGSRRYGYAVRFQRITRLNEREYQEQSFAWITPPGQLTGVHTYNRLPDREVFDGQWMEKKHRVL